MVAVVFESITTMWRAGDPTTFGNLPLDELIEDAVVESLKSKKHNGYSPSVGSQHELMFRTTIYYI